MQIRIHPHRHPITHGCEYAENNGTKISIQFSFVIRSFLAECVCVFAREIWCSAYDDFCFFRLFFSRCFSLFAIFLLLLLLLLLLYYRILNPCQTFIVVVWTFHLISLSDMGVCICVYVYVCIESLVVGFFLALALSLFPLCCHRFLFVVSRPFSYIHVLSPLSSCVVIVVVAFRSLFFPYFHSLSLSISVSFLFYFPLLFIVAIFMAHLHTCIFMLRERREQKMNS